ncbi:membrane protein insertion efficiency factor YidD [Amorphoplanes digitatis]|uniref:Putative membrane protein insertion efficiency factor n=1 Tax=Actinoplanes digitatis TaxID=1868 RepID=A0A7W7MP23_9ACTN|nr:putative membrane protein insertion efficiency factor [Actinoplanes digitatis]
MWGRKKRGGRKKSRWYDGCDSCDCDVCDLPCCDFGLLSTALLAFAGLGARGRSRRTDAAVSAAIRGYRRVSPRLPTRCRYTPTCSAYGLEAVRRYGTGKGLRLTAGRLRRCRPGVAFGTADPVP